jgi:hypothetical protein
MTCTIPGPIRALIETQSVALGLPADAVDLINQPKIFAKVFEAYQSKKAENVDSPTLGSLIFMLLKRNSAQPEKANVYSKELELLTQRNPSLLPLFTFASIYVEDTPQGLEGRLSGSLIKTMPDTYAYGLAKLGLKFERAKNKKAAESAYQAIIESSIDAQSPYRLMALLHLASIVQQKQPEKAAELFKATALQPDQCALYDVQPVMNKMPGLDWMDFGVFFESKGWVHTELDIDAKGKSSNVRIVASYPPFLLEQGASKLYSACHIK